MNRLSSMATETVQKKYEDVYFFLSLRLNSVYPQRPQPNLSKCSAMKVPFSHLGHDLLVVDTFPDLSTLYMLCALGIISPLPSSLIHAS